MDGLRTILKRWAVQFFPATFFPGQHAEKGVYMIGHRFVAELFLIFSVLFCQLSFGALSFEERVSCQKSIEEVNWRNTIWPASNPQPKPGLETVMPISQIGAKTQEYIRKSNAMEAFWQRPITSDQLQTEMERMAEETAAPDVLRELWASL